MKIRTEQQRIEDAIRAIYELQRAIQYASAIACKDKEDEQHLHAFICALDTFENDQTLVNLRSVVDGFHSVASRLNDDRILIGFSAKTAIH